MSRAHALDGPDDIRPGAVWEIDTGWPVFGVDGERAGDVDEVHPHWIVVARGLIVRTTRYVPVAAIAAVDRGRVTLAVPARALDDAGWDSPPQPPAPAGRAGPVRTPVRISAPDASPPRMVEATLLIEELLIERHPTAGVAGVLDSNDLAGAFQELEIVIPLRGEEIAVTKVPVVRERVSVGKVARERALPDARAAVGRVGQAGEPH